MDTTAKLIRILEHITDPVCKDLEAARALLADLKATWQAAQSAAAAPADAPPAKP